MGMLDNISVLPELERAGYQFQHASDGEVKGLCPFHRDSTPSCFINVEKRVFYCQSCPAKGDFVSFLSGYLRQDRALILVDLAKRYHLEDIKIIEPSVIEEAHDRIWEASTLLQELRKRGVTDDDIRKWRLGLDDKGRRIIIPVKNAAGKYVNTRRYMPGAIGKDKMRNAAGRGKTPRPYPIEQLSYDTVMICGGEIKAIVAARILNPHDIGAITCTGGEHNWPHDFIKQLEGKKVYVCLDIDESGVAAANEVAIRAYQFATWLGVVELPLDADKYPKGDLNDFVGLEHGDLWKVVRETEQWKPKYIKPAWEMEDEVPKSVQLSETLRPDLVASRVKFTAVITAEERTPYAIPKNVTVTCDRSQTCCALCPIFGQGLGEDTGLRIDIPAESPAILEMVGSNKRGQAEAMKSAFGIPELCKVVTFDVNSYYDVTVNRISPSLQLSNRDTVRSMLPAVCVGPEAQGELNDDYEFIGRMHPHPNTQEMTMVIGASEACTDSLGSYRPSTDDLSRLSLFQAASASVEDVGAQLDDLYDDFSMNITKIYQRQSMHLMVDLAYHSPLVIDFDGNQQNGWVQVLIVGDSSQGKSELVMRLMHHYQLGDKVECKNATVAGLLGGLAKFGDSWMVAWGVIPTNDKRLVVMEELKGAAVETIARLTDMRSSGIAEIPKIEKRRTHARTRIVALSNARNNSPIDSYSYGIQSVLELVGAPEDVRRFDAAMIVASADVDVEKINRQMTNDQHQEPRYSARACRELVLWAWTRKPEQVKFEDGVRDLIIKRAIKLSKKYSESIPLVDRGSTRFKIAKLSAALAARVFSCSDDRQTLIVRAAHVEYICTWLDGLYSDDTHGFARFSEALERKSKMVDHQEVRDAILRLPFPQDFCDAILYSPELTKWDCADWSGLDPGDSGGLISLLVRKRALIKMEDGSPNYRKSSDFVKLLRDLLESDAIAQVEKTRAIVNQSGEEF